MFDTARPSWQNPRVLAILLAVFLAGPKGDDGTVTAAFMYVEKDGIKPPM